MFINALNGWEDIMIKSAHTKNGKLCKNGYTPDVNRLKSVKYTLDPLKKSKYPILVRLSFRGL